MIYSTIKHLGVYRTLQQRRNPESSALTIFECYGLGELNGVSIRVVPLHSPY